MYSYKKMDFKIYTFEKIHDDTVDKYMVNVRRCASIKIWSDYYCTDD